jgi:hypothetical protein
MLISSDAIGWKKYVQMHLAVNSMQVLVSRGVAFDFLMDEVMIWSGDFADCTQLQFLTS